MLDLMMSEDELANVLGHELEHIDHYHCVERVQLEAKLKNLNLDVLGALLQIPSISGRRVTTRTKSSKPTRRNAPSGAIRLLAVRRRRYIRALRQIVR